MDPNEAIDEQVYKNLQKMTVNDDDVNILLLGETGVGKSTFINSFANYLEYDEFQFAEEDKVQCLIPAKFTVTTEDFEEKIVEIGKDNNENDTIAQSATLDARSYLFPVSRDGINRIRLIDTPGIGDTRGIDQDNENLENILSYISNLEQLHAICFLLKPNNSRLTVMFHYCIKQLLSRLEKSASRNIIFLFTNTRSTFYKPGDTTTALKSILQEIKSRPPYAEIKFTKDNVFCLDNESFRYLVAIKNGIQLGNKQSFIDSWNHSVTECWRMLNFITGKSKSIIKMIPHKVKDTVSVNDARRTVIQLSQPLADIAELINDNIRALERHHQGIQKDNLSITELNKNLYVPVINLRCKELSQPVTVCTATKCMTIYTVSGIKKCHYQQRCHNPCYLTNVPKELIGSPELVNCWAMTNRQCRICKCDFSTHMHIYYESETYDDRIDDQSVKAQIQTREAAMKETQKLIAKLEARKLDYEKEKDTIIKTMAKFAHFLQRNAIAPYNDAYKGYIEYLIDREKSLGDNCDLGAIKYMNELLSRYDQEKTILDQALSTNSGTGVTAADVFASVESLYNLPHTGERIKQMQTQMARNQSNEHGTTEVVLGEASRRATKQKQVNQKQKKQKQWDKNRQNENRNAGINQKTQPNMKAKNRRIDNREPRNYQNTNNNRQNMQFPSQYGRGNFPNQYNHPGNMQHPPNFVDFRPIQQQPGQHQGYQANFVNVPFNQQRGPPPSMSIPPHFMGGPNLVMGGPNPVMGGPPTSPNHQLNLRIPNYRQQNNFIDRQMYQNLPNYGNSEKRGPNNSQLNADDTSFNDWLKNVLGDNVNTPNTYTPQRNNSTSGGYRQYNNLHGKEVSSEEESSDVSSDSKISNDQDDDDDDFKEFMKQNNLEYLVKTEPGASNVNKNTTRKNQDKSKQSGHRGHGNVPQNNSDSHYDNANKGKIKEFLSKLWP